MSDLPPEIITIILVRLPVKSLLRFRCVSKPWRSLIDGEGFTKMHLRHSADRSLIVQSSLLLQMWNGFVQSYSPLQADLDIGNIPRIIKVKGCCNGLVLLACRSDKMFLWNPSTRKLNDLQAPLLLLKAGEAYWFTRCGLGYDSKHSDYKVVRVVQVSSSNGAPLFSETTIYSLKTNSWKKAAGDFPFGLMWCESRSVYVNDVLHFVLYSSGSGAEVLTVAFDLAKEEYIEARKPESAPAGVGFRLASVGGRLVVVVLDKREVWVMKEDGVKGSWCKLTNCVVFPEDDCVSLHSLAYSKGGVERLFNYQGARPYWYRLGNNQNVMVAHIEGSSGFLDIDMVLGASYDAWVCVASLVSPSSPYGVGEGEE